jgi:trans-aconitate methyltransferase
MAAVPEVRDIMLANRGFHGRAARWMAEQGVDQFIDVGSGLPTARNTHETVRRVIPEARVVYVDIDPMVAAYAGELVTDPENARVIIADARDPDVVLGHPEMTGLIDFTRPVGFLITAVLHFVTDDRDPWLIMSRYMSALAPGSYLALSHATDDKAPPRSVEAGRETYATSSQQLNFRSQAEIARFFDGLELVPPYQDAEPRLAYLGEWGAEDPLLADSDGSRWAYCGVARRP